jgi:hypothetical protein
MNESNASEAVAVGRTEWTKIQRKRKCIDGTALALARAECGGRDRSLPHTYTLHVPQKCESQERTTPLAATEAAMDTADTPLTK